MLLTAAVAAARVPSRSIDLLGDRRLEKIIPTRFGDWSFYSNSGLVVPPEDLLSEQLYSQLLTRVYTAPDRPSVMLLIAQAAGQTGILQIHRPEVCYPVGGFELSEATPYPVRAGGRTLSAVSLTASSPQRVEQLLYWTRVGYDLPESWVDQRISVARANFRGDIPDAVLVRLSTISADRDASLAALSSFLEQLVGTVDQRARAFLLGPA
jgi:EpsI family protein